MTSEPKKHGVVAVLPDETGRHLYIRRGLQLARAPGYWCFVGGEVEAGESTEAAIVREVFEEVGLEIRALEKIHETISPNGEFRLHWMRVELTRTGQEIRPHEKEVADACWLTMQEALALEPILPGLKAWLEKQLGTAQK
jgi:8-oxo-dGTP pyrophosphatase MutT (NUDIX family)